MFIESILFENVISQNVDIESYAKIADKFCQVENHQHYMEEEIDFI